MKPQLLKLSTAPTQSFSVRQDFVPYINNRWHYHAEVELIHFYRGKGTQFIGDQINHFHSGDIVLVGSQLPHYWRFDDHYFDEQNEDRADVRVAHFNEHFWGRDFLELPENIAIKQLLEKARRGIQVTGQAKQKVSTLLEQMLHSEGTRRIILLMEALHAIASDSSYRLISSIGFHPNLQDEEKKRINSIFDYTLANFRQKISLEDISAIAGISSNSFCRYFKAKTGKTYSRFLLEIRVGHACKLLIENKMSVKQLCYESGFNNFASFHKYFKQITEKSPLAYQKAFLEKA
ncbi:MULTISPECIES: AraC family transcriptional regulator [Olivibacter]|jgi:AraC-like DNA-binding protein|uniref:AraC family transcriptional regulator n=2 Tax=Olivibacter TaxID=376469 RepID=A0ABV6HEX7_9SPHI|nr:MULTISPECIES: AraC family transcriptional regulator [Olivibacter]MCL4638720.1 AraC family transcriptional regulator [Olivibacter sp. UJ_SKK_5.1]MDM8172789.1 AraC family transcriptional regulator [Olivibacter sp. 47]MDX3917096.1 AraC family transcriptional regulator [Pseudosphingobacterium sp.]QEL04243.1 helix-turn-helix domain-containing protein [Olivibacter sp. LS-1]